jgi:hypothetical protein
LALGRNLFGQLGLSYSPLFNVTDVRTLSNLSISAVSVSASHTLITLSAHTVSSSLTISALGQVLVSGSSPHGALGLGNNTLSVSSFTVIPSFSATLCRAGSNISLCIGSCLPSLCPHNEGDGFVYTFGSAATGLRGVVSAIDSTVPVALTSFSAFPIVDVKLTATTAYALNS